jgi:hypothetical protein
MGGKLGFFNKLVSGSKVRYSLRVYYVEMLNTSKIIFATVP